MASSDTKLDAEIISLGTLFTKAEMYWCPFFQRAYEWKPRPQIDDFLSALEDLLTDESDEHYLGAIILRDEKIPQRHPRTWTLIDGQQRLTTSFLTTLAVCELMYESAVARNNGDDQKTAIWIAEQHLMVDRDLKKARQPILRPTSKEDSFSQWKTLLKGVHDRTEGALNFDYKFVPGDDNKPGNVNTTYAHIQKWMVGYLRTQTPDQKQVERIWETLRERMKVVSVQVPENADPYQVFNDLNTKGVQLSAHDLAAISIFKRFDSDRISDAQRLYEDRWEPIEDKLGGERFDEFLFAYALCLNPQVQKKSLLRGLEDSWTKEKWGPNDIVSSIEQYVTPFCWLTDPAFAEGGTLGNELEERLRTLRDLKPSKVTYPYLMAVILAALEDDQFRPTAAALLLEVESFLVRRAVDRQEPTGLHALFKGLWSEPDGRAIGGLRTSVDKRATIEWVGNDVFKDRLTSDQTYGKNIARFLVSEFERSRKGDSASADQINEMQIEHVAPQEIAGSSWETVFPDPDEHAAVVNLWGNLVPLTTRGPASNSAAAREPWSGATNCKREIYKTSAFLTPREIANTRDDWTGADIRNSTEELADWAMGRWPE